MSAGAREGACGASHQLKHMGSNEVTPPGQRKQHCQGKLAEERAGLRLGRDRA